MAALIPPATRRAAARVCKALEGMMSLLSYQGKLLLFCGE